MACVTQRATHVVDQPLDIGEDGLSEAAGEERVVAHPHVEEPHALLPHTRERE